MTASRATGAVAQQSDIDHTAALPSPWEGPLRRLFAVLFFLAFANYSLFADQIAFKNGDRLTGTILKSDTNSLVIKTSVVGQVTAAWQDIQELSSDQPLYVGLMDGATLLGRVATREGSLEITTKTGKVEVPKENVAALRNESEQRAFERSLRRDFLHGWEGGLDAGFDLTRGNSDIRDFRFAFRAERKVGRDKLTLYAQSFYSIDDLPKASPHITVNENKGGARFDRDLTSRLFAFANADFMSDGLQDLNLRSVLGGGVGYHLIKRDRTTLDVLGGANFTRENYVEIQRNLGAGQFGEEFKLKLGKNTSLIQNFAYFPDLTEPGGNYRTNFRLGTVTMIIKRLGWENNLTDSYVTNPPAGKKRNEFVFTSGLHVSFSH
jgi:putative salt-induced outer membrane protein YdiY